MTPSLSLNAPPIFEFDNSVEQNIVRVGVIGYGYWGPNIVRNFHAQERSRVVRVCDKSPNSMRRVRQTYPDMDVTGNADDILKATDIDAAVSYTHLRAHE